MTRKQDQTTPKSWSISWISGLVFLTFIIGGGASCEVLFFGLGAIGQAATPSLRKTHEKYTQSHPPITIASVSFHKPRERSFDGRTWYNYVEGVTICFNNITSELRKKHLGFQIRVNQKVTTKSNIVWEQQDKKSIYAITRRKKHSMISDTCGFYLLYNRVLTPDAEERLIQNGVPIKELVLGNIKAYEYQVYLDPCEHPNCVKNGILQDKGKLESL